MLNKNLKYFREQKGFSQDTVAKAIGISRSTLSGYEKGRSKPKAFILKKLSNFLQIDMNDLFKESMDVPMFNQNLQKPNQDENIRTLAVTVTPNQIENIAFVPVSASAGYGRNFDKLEYVSQLWGFSLPKHTQGTYRAFEIKGDSMPPMQEGFIIIGQYVENLQDLKSGKRYVLITKNEGILFKRVTNEVVKKHHLLLTSDNPVYPASSMKIDELLEAWQMVSYIGFPNEETDMNQIILDKLRVIENKIKELS